MKLHRKKLALICGITVLFAVPLIVYAAVYHSRVRTNQFVPGHVDIQVKENSEIGEELEKTLMLDPETHSTEKMVQICDTRSGEREALRVYLVPAWYDENGNVCGTVFDFSSPVMDAEQNVLSYTDGDCIISLKLDDDWQANGWEYQADNGFFCYTGALQTGSLTPTLLERVELNDPAYALTESYTLRLDVLADAIQTSGNARTDRNW